MIKGGTVRDGEAKVHLRDGTGPLTNIKHINPRTTAPARTSICYGRNGVSPFPSLSIGQRIYLLDPHIPISRGALITGPIAALILGNGEEVPDTNLRAETK